MQPLKKKHTHTQKKHTHTHLSNMNGSELYNKYKKVHIGAFINIHTDVLSGVKDWLTGNLFYKEKDAPQAYLIPLDPSKPRQSFTNVCNKYGVDKKKEYTTMEDGIPKTRSILQSFKMEQVFKTNDNGGVVHDSYRLMIEEQDLQIHPKYGDIQSTIEEIRSQVCAFASRVKGNNKKMYSRLTVLYSQANGPVQGLHMDDMSTSKTEEEYVLSCIVALEDKTSLVLASSLNSEVTDTCTISKGSFILFCGSQVHGRASYSTPNIRLHFYLHEDLETLNQVANGKIVLKCACTVPGCTYYAKNMDYLVDRHYNVVHKGWWEYQKMLRKEKYFKLDANGRYPCIAKEGQCDHQIKLKTFGSENGLRRHYKAYHKEWWEKRDEEDKK